VSSRRLAFHRAGAFNFYLALMVLGILRFTAALATAQGRTRNLVSSSFFGDLLVGGSLVPSPSLIIFSPRV